MTHLLFEAVFRRLHYYPSHPAEAVVQLPPWQGSAMGALKCAVLLVTLTTVLWFA